MIGNLYPLECYVCDGATYETEVQDDGDIRLPENWCFVKVWATPPPPAGNPLLAPCCPACAEDKREAGREEHLVYPRRE